MNLNKIILIIVIAVLLIAGAVVFFASRSNGLFSDNASVKLGQDTFSLEVADTYKERQIGLSDKKSLGDRKGMIFLFDEPTIPAFWMKDMDFPIDIIFLNGNRVVSVFRNVPAPENKEERLPTYQPASPIDRVIEVKAGTAEKYSIDPGDELTVSL